jgi:hypothetical protein
MVQQDERPFRRHTGSDQFRPAELVQAGRVGVWAFGVINAFDDPTVLAHGVADFVEVFRNVVVACFTLPAHGMPFVVCRHHAPGL